MALLTLQLQGHGFWVSQYVNAFQKNPPYSQDELKYLVSDKHFIVSPPGDEPDLEHFDALTLEQYSQKIELYLSSLRNIN